MFLFKIIPTLINMSVSKSMTLKSRDVESIGYATFERFLKEFDKIGLENWKRDPIFQTSFFYDSEKKTEIHAGVVCFNGNAMLFKFRDQMKFDKWLEYHKQPMKKKEKKDWN